MEKNTQGKLLKPFALIASMLLVSTFSAPALASVTLAFNDVSRAATVNTFWTGNDLRAEIYITSGVTFTNANQTPVSLTAADFEIFGGVMQSAVTADRASYYEDTSNSLSINVFFDDIRSSLCEGGSSINVNVLRRVTIAVGDSANADLVEQSIRLSFLPGQLSPCQIGSQNTTAETPTPAKYSGPEFSGLSGMGIMTGSTGKLEGKRLDQISSIEIGGEAATFTATSAAELELSLPAGLAPGLYDLVINSSAGKLTHINAIQVREPKQSFSITTRSEGRISEEQYQEHAIISSMQIPELDKARCIVNGSNLAQAKAQAERLCALVAAANPNIETTVVEARSTVRNNAVFARVTYGWN